MSIKVVSQEGDATTKTTQPAAKAASGVKSGDSTAQEVDKSAPAGKAVQEQNASKSDNEETEATEEEGSEQDDEAGATEDEAEGDELEAKDKDAEGDESKESEKPKRKGGIQRRFDKLTARAVSAEDRAAAAEREVATFRERLSALERGKPDYDASAREDDEPEIQADPKDPEPDSEKFKTAAEYTKALAAWQYRQEKAKDAVKTKRAEERRKSLDAEKSMRELVSNHQSRVDEFADEHEDFPEKMKALMKVPNSPAIANYVVSSEQGPAILYELGKNVKEASRIAGLPPSAQVKELAKIEVRLERASEAAKEKEPDEDAEERSTAKESEKQVTKAPRPLKTVGSGKSGATKSVYSPGLSQSEYEALRNQNQRR